jgi:hypothetical protein
VTLIGNLFKEGIYRNLILSELSVGLAERVDRGIEDGVITEALITIGNLFFFLWPER